MRVLVDTHALLWAITGDRKLSKRAHSVLASFANEVFFSAASAWEITTKHRLGKLPAAEGLVADFGRIIEQLVNRARTGLLRTRAPLRRNSFTTETRRTRSFGFYGAFSVISVTPWLISIPVAGPQAHVTLR